MAFFEWLSRVGVTLHPGGWATTQRLLAHLPLGEGKLVADFGCGAGRTLVYVAQRYKVSVIGVDLMPSLAAQACQRLRVRGITDDFAVAADICRLPFWDEVFHVAFAESVFVFLPKPNAFMEVARVLKSGGYFGMIELTWRNEPNPEYCEQVRKFLDVPHYDVLSMSDWMQMLMQAGLQVGIAEKLPSYALSLPMLQLFSDFWDVTRLALGLLRQVPLRKWQEGFREVVGLLRYTVPGIFVAVKI